MAVNIALLKSLLQDLLCSCIGGYELQEWTCIMLKMRNYTNEYHRCGTVWFYCQLHQKYKISETTTWPHYKVFHWDKWSEQEWHLWHNSFCQVWFQLQRVWNAKYAPTHTHRFIVTISFTQGMSSNHRNLHIYIKFLFSMTSYFCTIWPWTVYLTSSALN